MTLNAFDILYQAAFDVAKRAYEEWAAEDKRMQILCRDALQGKGSPPDGYWNAAHAAFLRYRTAAVILEEIEQCLRQNQATGASNSKN